MRSRSDVPPDLLARAKSIDPSLAAWLEAAYPTDAEHERAQRLKRAREQKQLKLPEVA